MIGSAVVALLAGASRLPAQQAAETPAQLYGRSCAACHGATGVPAPAMATSMGIPNFTDPHGVAAKPDSVLANSIRAGKGKMPAYGTRLSADQIRQLVTYIKSLRH
ncbi:MAG: c-type cytochrome [Gemmatimonadales bacterium]